ncbi:MAG: hypothetical protein HY669_00725 [Chloroflexi bacterium]|nr:hypothetical protein [Chloroflexota bacterium]
MEEKHLRPSALQNRNLAILIGARRDYFTNKGIYPYLLSTYFFYVEETARLPLVRILLPLIADDNNRRILQMAVARQGEQWEPLKPFESFWTFFRKAGIASIKNQQFEDLIQLDYYRLLDGISVPNKADISLFWGGLVDFLVNSWSILEEFCAVITVKDEILVQSKTRQEGTPQIKDKGIPIFVPLVYWADMQLEHHLINILLRLRAGWDKLADYVLAPYYGVVSAKKWVSRIDKLDKEIPPTLNDRQRLLWANWLTNAQEVSREKGLRYFRDLELHKIALRAKETLGDLQHAPALSELENFVLFEHFRLQESFLLVLAMIRLVDEDHERLSV